MVALALSRDPLHDRAVAAWDDLLRAGAKLRTSIPVILETFTFLERNARREVALAWKDSLGSLRRFRRLEREPSDIERAWEYLTRRDLHRLSAVDATSFAIMKRERIFTAFAFDHHFASVGFGLAG